MPVEERVTAGSWRKAWRILKQVKLPASVDLIRMMLTAKEVVSNPGLHPSISCKQVQQPL